MSTLNKLSIVLIAVTIAACAALIVGTTQAEAGVFSTPAGGWGVERPAPQPAPAPRRDGFASSAGGDPNV